MNTPHKYVKEIIHWANGGDIQHRTYSCGHDDSNWIDLKEDDHPNFNITDQGWRIKPKALQYRVALMQTSDKSYFTRTQSSNTEEFVDIELDMEDGFVRWIPNDKWIEVEV